MHQDSWVVLVNGGHDRDSPYEPAVDPNDPALPPGFESSPERFALLIDQGHIGSPTAFRSNVVTRLANGQLVVPPFTVSYPNFDPSSVFRAPHVARYWRASLPGQAYAMVVAVDAHGQSRPMSPVEAVAITDLVDAGGGTAADRRLRRQVLTFHVSPTTVNAAARDPEPAPGSGGLRSRR